MWADLTTHQHCGMNSELVTTVRKSGVNRGVHDTDGTFDWRKQQVRTALTREATYENTTSDHCSTDGLQQVYEAWQWPLGQQ